MRKMFSYKKFNSEQANTLVEAFGKLTDMYMNNQGTQKEYKEANKLFSENLVEYCVTASNMDYSSIDMIKDPMVHGNIMFKQSFATILAQAISPVVPAVIASGYDQLFDVHQVGFGDNAKFTVDSNELYIVNDLAEGIKRGAQSTIYNREFTVSAKRKQIATFVDWYQVAAGVQDWGKFGVRIGVSYAAYIQGLVAKEMTQVIVDAGKHGISGYRANGFSDLNWLTLKRNVSLANGGAAVYALGTDIAIGKILPEAAAFRFGPESDIVTKGVLPAYKDVALVGLGNALIPNTINGEPKALVGDDFLYFLAMGHDKPAKVVIEGNTVSISEDPLSAKDHCFSMSVDMRVGVGAVVGSKFGYMKLN